MKNTNDLFDVLCEKTGCEYMSDMKYESHREAVYRAASELRKEDFRLKQWTEFVTDYLREDIEFSTYDEVEIYFEKKRLALLHNK